MARSWLRGTSVASEVRPMESQLREMRKWLHALGTAVWNVALVLTSNHFLLIFACTMLVFPFLYSMIRAWLFTNSTANQRSFPARDDSVRLNFTFTPKARSRPSEHWTIIENNTSLARNREEWGLPFLLSNNFTTRVHLAAMCGSKFCNRDFYREPGASQEIWLYYPWLLSLKIMGLLVSNLTAQPRC